MLAALALAPVPPAPAPAPVSAAVPALPGPVAYVRDGDVYTSRGAIEKRLTTGGGHARPRWSPEGRRLAYLTGGRLWTMQADGTGARRLTTRAAAGPSWSPDGKWIAFASLSCSGGPGVYRIPSAGGKVEVLFPNDCRHEPLPAEPAITGRRSPATLDERLRTDDAVAWSPDGRRVAFRGGDCESIVDDCLTIGTIADGTEQPVAGYGGGGTQNSGFAVVPAWRPDGAKLAWTAAQIGETPASNEPIHVVEYDVASRTKRTLGTALDRELSYAGTGKAVVTGRYRNGSWLFLLDLATNTRTPLHPGSQPTSR
ncbi:hypothetical protein [Actinoplanes sp. NPDC051851]|uniref:TolB family protein n=1 Tax=Actinoplanes sp. NPDC051851 TaxID=3154753 RepID=UPI0034438F5F